MAKDSLFIVIEGLDGSGKSTAARQLATVLNAALGNKAKLSFEPHDPSCAGIFIRQVLTKKITAFSPRVLALAYATNRLDHCARVIDPWLARADKRMVICDRYYLSSLVYQSSAGFPFSAVMQLNEKARKPDFFFFINVSDETCYARMKKRNQPRELFEENLSQTRTKYAEAIDFLKKENGDHIIEIDGSGTVAEVVGEMLQKIRGFAPGFLPNSAAFDLLAAPPVFRLGSKKQHSPEQLAAKLGTSAEISEQAVSAAVSELAFGELAALFLHYLSVLGYDVKDKMPLANMEGYALAHQLPGGPVLRGAALFLPEQQRYDLLLKTAPELAQSTDFLLVFAPDAPGLATKYFERSQFRASSGSAESLFPATSIFTRQDLTAHLFRLVKKQQC